MASAECQLEQELIEKLLDLKYVYREDLRDRASLEKNFREKFQSLDHVKLTDDEFERLLAEIVTPDVFTAAHTLRNRSAFTRDDGTPLNYTLVNISDWCKNTFEVVHQLRINTNNTAIETPRSRQNGLASLRVIASAAGIMMSIRRLRSRALRLVEAALISPKQRGSFA